jgi:hypothetical protein
MGSKPSARKKKHQRAHQLFIFHGCLIEGMLDLWEKLERIIEILLSQDEQAANRVCHDCCRSSVRKQERHFPKESEEE